MSSLRKLVCEQRWEGRVSVREPLSAFQTQKEHSWDPLKDSVCKGSHPGVADVRTMLSHHPCPHPAEDTHITCPSWCPLSHMLAEQPPDG